MQECAAVAPLLPRASAHFVHSPNTTLTQQIVRASLGPQLCLSLEQPRKPREAGAGAGEAGAKDAAPRAAKKSRSRKNKGTER